MSPSSHISHITIITNKSHHHHLLDHISQIMSPSSHISHIIIIIIIITCMMALYLITIIKHQSHNVTIITHHHITIITCMMALILITSCHHITI
jgi:Fe2+ transport system protein B